MCADSQETCGDFKWPVKKLAFPRVTTGNFHILISGAGFGPAIDTATQKIFERTAMHAPTCEQTLHIIESVLREIHEKDLRFYPTNDPSSLQFRLLIAFNSGGNGGLFVSDGSLLTRVDSYKIIGSGEVTEFFAHTMYRQNSLWETPDIGISEGSVLAAFLLYLAKSQLTSVGGKGQIAVIQAGHGLKFANVWEMPAWERVLPQCLEIVGKIILGCANPYLSEKDFSRKLQKEHGSSLKALKKSLAKSRAYWDKVWQECNEAGVMLLGHTPIPPDSETQEDQQ
jgi:hypothetical protein